MKMHESIVNDDFINNLAANWYFLSLQFGFQDGRYADEVSNELIENGLQLKSILRAGSYTYLQPLNVYVDMDSFIDIWLDADGDIQTRVLDGED